MIGVVIYITAALGFGAGVGVTLIVTGINDMIKERGTRDRDSSRGTEAHTGR